MCMGLPCADARAAGGQGAPPTRDGQGDCGRWLYIALLTRYTCRVATRGRRCCRRVRGSGWHAAGRSQESSFPSCCTNPPAVCIISR